MSKWMRASSGVVAAVFISGCSNSATLQLRNGREVEGRIVRSDAKVVWVEGTRGDSVPMQRHGIVDVTDPVTGEPAALALVLAGGVAPVAIEREKIVDVTHPGNTEIGMAGALAVASASLFIYGFGSPTVDNSNCDRGCDTSAAPHFFAKAGAIILLVPALILAIDGFGTYDGSQSRYAPPKTVTHPRARLSFTKRPSRTE